MITVDDIITRILETTEYKNVGYLGAAQEDLAEVKNLPRISIGYATIASKNKGVTTEHNLLNQNLEDLVQSFIIQIVSSVEDFPTIWRTIYSVDVLLGWNPISEEAAQTGITYSGGSIVGVSNDKQRWQDFVNIGFPTISRS